MQWIDDSKALVIPHKCLSKFASPILKAGVHAVA